MEGGTSTSDGSIFYKHLRPLSSDSEFRGLRYRQSEGFLMTVFQQVTCARRSEFSLRGFKGSAMTFSSGLETFKLVPMISGMLSQYSSHTWIHIWIHRSWNVAYEFTIMKSYMNSLYEFISEFMIMNNIMKSYVWIHMYEFIYEIMSLNSWLWNHIWHHIADLIFEFSAVKNIVKSWLNSWKWIHIWNHVEFFSLK